MRALTALLDLQKFSLKYRLEELLLRFDRTLLSCP